MVVSVSYGIYKQISTAIDGQRCCHGIVDGGSSFQADLLVLTLDASVLLGSLHGCLYDCFHDCIHD